MLSLVGLLCCLLNCCAPICSHLLQHPAAGCCVPDKERRTCHSCPCSCSAASSVCGVFTGSGQHLWWAMLCADNTCVL